MAHHGNTPAAWTAVIIATLGFVVGGVGSMVPNWILFWIGVAMQPIAAAVGYIMGRAGYGSTPRSAEH